MDSLQPFVAAGGVVLFCHFPTTKSQSVTRKIYGKEDRECLFRFRGGSDLHLDGGSFVGLGHVDGNGVHGATAATHLQSASLLCAGGAGVPRVSRLNGNLQARTGIAGIDLLDLVLGGASAAGSVAGAGGFSLHEVQAAVG